MLADAEARLVFANPIAVADLQAGRLALVNGRLCTSAAEVTSKLQTAVARAARVRDPVPTTVLAPEEAAGAFSIAVAPFLEATTQAEPLALLILERPRGLAEEDVQATYGLTRSEAALLTALVRGERLADYAGRRAIKLTTVKTHLKSVFSKIGEQRQADLIRRVLCDHRLLQGR
jgi:DNA-binding CsgD family transcriptional regulator